jgi:hypothetical protein
MTTPAFYKNYIQILKAAELCLDQDLHMPSLILVFTLIDSFAWAASDKAEKQNRNKFESWLKSWVYPYSQLPCTPTELYAARCGVLHTLTSKADLNARKGIRQVAYAWGPAKLSTLQSSVEVINRPEIVGVHINELLNAVKEGIARTIEASETDPKLAGRLAQAASLHFSEMPRQTLEKLLELHEAHSKL